MFVIFKLPLIDLVILIDIKDTVFVVCGQNHLDQRMGITLSHKRVADSRSLRIVENTVGFAVKLVHYALIRHRDSVFNKDS